MNDLRFAFRQLLKNPGFAAGAVLTVADAIRAAQQTLRFTASQSGLGLARFGIEQAHARHLPCVHQIPINANPNDEEFGSGFGWDGKVFRVSDRQCLAVGEVQLERAERGSIAHFLKVRNFHIPDSIVN